MFAKAFRGLAVLLAMTAGIAQATEPVPLRIGLAKFGTVSWEIDTMVRNGLDRAAGLDVEIVELANSEAGKVALMGGRVDMIVGDWLWTSRQRSEGEDISFVPYSTAVGGLVVPKESSLASLADLKGKRIGVAGGPLDKNWLLLRALVEKEHGFDLAKDAEPTFAAPPLLNQQFEAGRLDAALTYWNYGAKLEAQGHRRLIDVEEVAARLGVETAPPALGYLFRESWAAKHPRLLESFVGASWRTKMLLARDDAAWEPLRPLVQAENAAAFTALREGYRAGIPRHWGENERAGAAKLYGILAEIGGQDLVGRGTALAEGTFWPGVRMPPEGG
ncbi:ABC transporter substrate-binding protein [Azospirillum sp. SYSU D00513]|uniref:ABC transporter substrate-binding protein n=1 Tax=Azospirillum sp. SYSU D00513 TaxID=2812561 RepID=UPI001A967A73|nr:ABC transporter substrate-binding protein [Azospirillum sp. SYSU D00513]